MRLGTLAGMVLAAAALLGMTPAAEAQCYIAYVHGKGDDLSPGVVDDTARANYWRRDSSDTYGDFVRYSRGGCTTLVTGYNGRASFWDPDSAARVGQQIDDFITQHDIQPGQLRIIGHSMGGLVSRWILNQGVPGSIYYNQVPGVEVGNGTDVGIPDNDATGATSTVSVPSSTWGTLLTTTVDVNVDIRHTWSGDLDIYLEHAGRSVLLRSRQGGSDDNVIQWFNSVSGFEGTPAAGAWTLRVVDRAGADVGHISHVGIRPRSSVDYDRIRRATAYLITVATPHLGAEPADAVYGTADTLCGHFVGWIMGALGERNRATDYLRRINLEYASVPSGGWLVDHSRTTRMYTISTRQTSGLGELEDVGLQGVWWCLGNNDDDCPFPWFGWEGCGDSYEPGDGLVSYNSGRALYERSGSTNGLSWSSGTWVVGARTAWLDTDFNHHQVRRDAQTRLIENRVTGQSTTTWMGSYIGANGLSLQP